MAGALIQVENLTKRYAGRAAVEGVSFEVGRGEIVGLLGPNGAGKTTILRILSCYLPATSGRARVLGMDLGSQSLEIRRKIGYLPENAPLYPEMRVDEYLRHRAGLKGVPKAFLKSRCADAKERCGLAAAGRRIIGQLSKGYRQRVGLADTLLHDPELLILDEPAIGLDPNQIRQARDLMQALSDRHTILLSTHNLTEAELTCRRVLILNRGRIAASDTPEALRTLFQGGARLVAELRGGREEQIAALRALPGAARVDASEAEGWTRFTVDCGRECDLRLPIYELAARHGWPLRELRRDRHSLEEVFAALTRDGGGAAP